jgi:hypothetical protein
MHLPRETRVTIPELALIAGTRAMAGFGLGLLLADCLSEEKRRAIGWTLLLVGGLTTIPLAFEVFGRRADAPGGEPEQAESRPSVYETIS